MKLKINFLLVFFTVSMLRAQAQQEPVISIRDFEPLIGNWEGTITYLDYTTNKPFTMPAALTVRLSKNNTAIIFENSYPKEPKANSNDTSIISENGKLINAKVIRSKRKLANGDLEIITEYLQTDGNDNKPAIIRNTYTIGKDMYVNRKDVQFVLGSDWIKRSEYAYKKKIMHDYS